MSETKYIAVVDDHTLFRKGLCALIDMFPGYKVLFDAADGEDFKAKLKPPHIPDIVLMDISMPRMDGYDTTSWLRVNHPEVRVLALSTMESDAAILKMIRNGARGYLLKDVEPSELKLAFQEVISKGYFYNDVMTRKVMQSLPVIVNDKSSPAKFLKLTPRETEFLKHVCSEKTYSQIAEEMSLSERTIDGYRETLFRKLDISSRIGLVLYAIKNKIVEL